jgi:Zn-dependent metalloprotease
MQIHHHRCLCAFIPPQVLENIAKTRDVDPNLVNSAVLTLQQGKLVREKRDSRQPNLDALSAKGTIYGVGGIAPAGQGPREVYDCKHTWAQRVAPAVRLEGGPGTADQATTSAYDFAGNVREYLATVMGRNSIDNLGMKLILNVHFGVNYMNAFWDGDEMTFGDGDGQIFTNFSKSLDVVAHELAHGVTQFTANLEYQGQSGALNEHFSDVFGTAITQYIDKQKANEADWCIGDEIMGPDLFGESLRSMRAPGSAYDNSLMGKDPQPDHMSNYYAGPADHHGVHINSGIPNRAFYLTAKEIGTDNAVKIWYHALQRLWPTAKFNDAVHVISESARILTKNNAVPIGAPQVVRASFKAVGLPT